MWSELLTELLQKIVTSDALTDEDVYSFASVCQSWRSAAGTVKHPRRHHTPWLLFADKEDPDSAKFYDLSKNKFISLPNQPYPPIANRYIVGSGRGWLITADEKSELSLLNPLTRQQIDLPPLTTISNYVLPCRSGSDGKISEYSVKVNDGRINVPVENVRYFFILRAALLMAANSADYLVVLYLNPSNDLAFARCGDKKWAKVNESFLTTDIVFHDDGKLYTTGYSGEVNSWDFNHKDISLVKPELVFHQSLKPHKMEYFYYVLRTPEGELLYVRRDRDFGADIDIPADQFTQTVKIKVWRIDFNDGFTKLVRLRSLGDNAIFLGGHMSTCLSSKDYPALRGNCAYVSDEFVEHSFENQNKRRDIGVFNLNDGSFERILPHDTRLYWPPPIWYMPIFSYGLEM